MKAMLLAAGLGTRLKPFTDHHPKALAPVNGKPLLQHNVEYLQRYGIYDVVVNVHHFADQIEKAIDSSLGWGSNIIISDERTEVLETGGGLLKASSFFKHEDAVIVMNADVLTSLDLSALQAGHNALQPLATLAVMNRPSSRQLLFDDKMTLCGWQNNNSGVQRMARNAEGLKAMSFSGIQVISRKLIEGISRSGKFSLIDAYLDAATTGIIKGHDHSSDIFVDAGKPESLERAALLFR